MDIVVRAAIIYLFLWVITRSIGRATLGELSTFQLLMYVTMGDLVQQGVTQQDYSVTGAVLAVGTFALLTVVISFVNVRWPRAEPLTHGVPVVVVRDGSPITEALRSMTLSFADLSAAAREQGIRAFGDIELAVLEADGKVSFFTKDGKGSGAPAPAGGGG
jgi:uncharacterized membrane protein YcaP (DUF421 family)